MEGGGGGGWRKLEEAPYIDIDLLYPMDFVRIIWGHFSGFPARDRQNSEPTVGRERGAEALRGRGQRPRTNSRRALMYRK